MRESIFAAIAAVFLIVNTQTSHAEEAIDREAERAQMLSLIESPPVQKLQIQGLRQAPREQKELLKHFQSKIWKRWEKIQRLSIVGDVLHVALDRALYRSPREKEAWMKRKKKAEQQVNKLSTDPKFHRDIRVWRGLAEGLEGDFADFTRRYTAQFFLAQFTQREAPLLDQQTELETKVTDLANTAKPGGKEIGETIRKQSDIIAAFHRGERSFEESWKAIEALMPESRSAKGNNVANEGRETFMELAKVRTELAKRKGYNNYAEYVLATQARHYAPGMKTPKEKVDFLKQILSATEKPYRKFLEKRAEEIEGLDPEKIRLSQRMLLTLETETLLRDYLPKTRAVEEWRKAMIQSGFSAEAVNRVSLDVYPRENKQTHAYMATITEHEPQIFGIDAASLAVDRRGPSEVSWNLASSFIVQNFSDDGPDAWETMWHEGGHALDYAHREDIYGFHSAYGYTEIHSMMMEHFLLDLAYLMSIAKKEDGTPVDEEVAKTFILNKKVNEILSGRVQAAYALYDILLWDYDYSAPDAEDFVERAKRLYGELVGQAILGEGHNVDGVDWKAGGFVTNHFYSGNIRYFGYIVANMAAALSAEKLWEELEAETGRRSFLEQPTLAEKIIEGYYRHGFEDPFPKSVEAFIGQPFDPDAFVEGMIGDVEGYEPNCGESLRAVGGAK